MKMIHVEIMEIAVTQMGFAMILQNNAAEKIVPIFIGPLETYSISSVLENRRSERPLTHDLMETILKNLGQSVEKVEIHDFKDGVFIGRLYINSNDGSRIYDVRPSDGVAMAIRFRAPILMSEEIYKQTSLDASLLTRSEEDGSEIDIPLDILEELNFETEKIMNQGETSEKESRLNILRRKLDEEVALENYEEAARLRDEISLLLGREF